MIEFVTILLGLIVGVSDIEVSFLGDAARIELRLDGQTVATRSEEPWLFEVDFGSKLVPHELEAVAYDARGREIDRASQWVNLKQRPAEAAMILSGGSSGRPDAVSLIWQSLGQRLPESIEMHLDGQPLQVTNPDHIPLPAYDPDQMHFLSAVMRFNDESSFQLETAFGGGRLSQVDTELTAMAVTIEDGSKAPSIRQLRRWFRGDGKPLAVHGVERGSAEVIVVRDPSAQPLLEELIALIRSWNFGMLGQRAAFGQLGEEVSVSVLSPAGAPLSPSEITPQMFVRSASLDAEDNGLLWLTQQVRPQSFAMYFTNAVALAGMQSHASTRRRAVVLMLGESRSEADSYAAENVREYLRLLQVPLFVWNFTDQPHPEWPEAEHLPLDLTPNYRHKPFKQAVKRLRDSLDAQRIVWLEGRHLPHTVELDPKAEGIRITGL